MLDTALRDRFLHLLHLLLATLVVVTVAVPTTLEFVPGEHSLDEPEPVERRGLLASMSWAWRLEAEDLGSLELHPYSLEGGLWMVRIGLTVLVLTLGALAYVLLSAAADSDAAGDARLRPLLFRVLALVWLLALGLTALGTGWLPEDELGISLVRSSWCHVGLGVWTLFLAGATADLRESERPVRL
ncbi:hypothetical protein [Nocardioides pantholopis]|uniref:hypothetical protein n=1 Tax=Nocardioides pantholopis TaxID=2483798 RepID=UPI000F08F6F4|nr:hypothetical protein [Nocardioides pantholopis]